MPTPTPVLEVPAQFDAWSLAEWVEQSMVIEEADSWTKTAILKAFPQNAMPEASEAEQLLAEIRRRAALSPANYPFREQAGVITRDKSVDARIYEFLVIASAQGAPFRRRKSNEFNRANRILDLLVRESVTNYVGGASAGARAVRFGWPVQDGRPKKLKKAVKWLAKELGLKKGQLRFVPEKGKDAGVDVVAWRPFAGGGTSFTCYLVQNTMQWDYRRKPGDIAVHRWAQIIDFRVPPQIALAVPFAVAPKSAYWGEVSFKASLFIDRLRLIEHLKPSDVSGEPEWPDLAAFVTAQRAGTLGAMSTSSGKSAGRKKKR